LDPDESRDTILASMRLLRTAEEREALRDVLCTAIARTTSGKAGCSKNQDEEQA
jgi:hypothetical protein